MMTLLLAALAATPPAPSAPAAGVHGQVVITSVSSEPSIPSGVLATAVRITGQIGSRTEHYFIFFHGQALPKPTVGATCSIAFERFAFQLHFGAELRAAAGGRAVRSFTCDDGTAGNYGLSAVTVFHPQQTFGCRISGNV